MMHGVPLATKLPSSVASLGTIPAQVTLPIACGKITRLKWRLALMQSQAPASAMVLPSAPSTIDVRKIE